MAKVKVPPVDHPMSSLDGYSLIGIDTDPPSQLYSTIVGLTTDIGHGVSEVVAIVPVKFHGVRPGYLVIAYDKSKDPRAEEAES